MNVLLQTIQQCSSMKTCNVLGIFWSLGAQQNFFINHKAADILCLKNETVSLSDFRFPDGPTCAVDASTRRVGAEATDVHQGQRGFSEFGGIRSGTIITISFTT